MLVARLTNAILNGRSCAPVRLCACAPVRLIVLFFALFPLTELSRNQRTDSVTPDPGSLRF
jgi:hypothetical protein